MKKEKIIEILKSNRALLEEFHVRSLSVFGSIVRGESDPESDVDILVEFEPGADIGLFEFIRLRDALSDLIGMPVDMGTPDALHPALKDDILREALHVA
ncbi:MAG: nucleotidyltransferase family protein [Desulfoferrobacter sp.]